MQIAYSPCFLPLAAWFFSLAGTAVAIPMLKRAQVLDMPSARSNHAAPTPRGGGAAMVLSALLFCVAAGLSLAVALAAALLAAVSFADDLRPLPASVRLLAQALAVTGALYASPPHMLQGLPASLEVILVALAWIWYMNLTNFMDGIDGITAVETMSVGLGIALLGVAKPELPPVLAHAALVIAAAAFGFYAFNRAPAKVFMGDVGSVTLGFLLGYLLLGLAARGLWPAALILPAYYLCDATFTLLKRLLRREPVWQAHSQHAYQQAVRKGMGHAAVVGRIALLNAALVVLALVSCRSMMAGMLALATAYFLTACLLYRFHALPAR